MRDAWWYIWNFLLGTGIGTIVVVCGMKIFVFFCEKFSGNPKYKH
jgi:hypothetical protein